MARLRNLAILAALSGVVALHGCYTGPAYVPVASGGTIPASFDASWAAARGAAADEGVRITSEDRSSGTLRGDKGSSSVLISVVTQADGSVRVGFTVSGPSGQDPTLQDRLTRAYQRRMGR